MDNVRSEINDSKNSLPNDGHEQFPVDTRVVTLVRLVKGGGGAELARIVVMNDQATPQPSGIL